MPSNCNQSNCECPEGFGWFHNRYIMGKKHVSRRTRACFIEGCTCVYPISEEDKKQFNESIPIFGGKIVL
jgi:hypothetical protein